MDIRPTVVRLLLVVPLLAAGIALGTRTGMAAAAPCATTINGGTIMDSVVVKAPDICILSGVTVAGGTPISAIIIHDSEVRGDHVVIGTLVTGTGIGVERNSVRGSLVVRDNVLRFGAVIVVLENAIEVDLDCSGNNVNPLGVSNTVGGVATGQCAGLIAP